MSYFESASDKWEFQIERSKVEELARQRQQHHEDRLVRWITKRDEIERGMREGGVTFVAYDHSGGRGVQASIDQQMSVDLSQAMKRIAFHEREIEFFESVIAGITNDRGTGTLPLRLEDVRRFGLVYSALDTVPE